MFNVDCIAFCSQSLKIYHVLQKFLCFLFLLIDSVENLDFDDPPLPGRELTVLGRKFPYLGLSCVKTKQDAMNFPVGIRTIIHRCNIKFSHFEITNEMLKFYATTFLIDDRIQQL